MLSRLSANSPLELVTPVRLPAGRARLGTRPVRARFETNLFTADQAASLAGLWGSEFTRTDVTLRSARTRNAVEALWRWT